MNIAGHPSIQRDNDFICESKNQCDKAGCRIHLKFVDRVFLATIGKHGRHLAAGRAAWRYSPQSHS
jgi:hypothetical protein